LSFATWGRSVSRDLNIELSVPKHASHDEIAAIP
jgi:hypothetical protein